MRKLLSMCGVVLAVGCWSTAGDPFGYKKPPELITICHAEFNEETGFWDFQMRMYRDDTVKLHLKHHVLDYAGECGSIYK